MATALVSVLCGKGLSPVVGHNRHDLIMGSKEQEQTEKQKNPTSRAGNYEEFSVRSLLFPSPSRTRLAPHLRKPGSREVFPGDVFSLFNHTKTQLNMASP